MNFEVPLLHPTNRILDFQPPLSVDALLDTKVQSPGKKKVPDNHVPSWKERHFEFASDVDLSSSI
jgi:hypothetical protein